MSDAASELLAALERFRLPIDRADLRELISESATLARSLRFLRALGDDGPLVAVLAGGANAGKSTLINVLAGSPVSAPDWTAGATKHALLVVHRRHRARVEGLGDILGETIRPLENRDDLTRPSTARHLFLATHACEALADVVLVDTPDLTTTDAANRLLARRMLALASVVVWVQTPERYADAIFFPVYKLVAGLDRQELVAFNKAESGPVEHLRECWTSWTGRPPPMVFALPYVPAASEDSRAQSLARDAMALAGHLAELAGRRGGILQVARAATARCLADRTRQVAEAARGDLQSIARARVALDARFAGVVDQYRRALPDAPILQRTLLFLKETLGEAPAARLRLGAGDDGRADDALLPHPPSPEADLIIAQAMRQAGAPSVTWGIGHIIGSARTRVLGKPDAGTVSSDPAGDAARHLSIVSGLLDTERRALAELATRRAVLGESLMPYLPVDEGDASVGPVPWDRIAAYYSELLDDCRRQVASQEGLFRRMLNQALARHVPLVTALGILEGAVGIPPGTAVASALAIYELLAVVAETPELVAARRTFASGKAVWLKVAFDHRAARGLHRRLRALARRGQVKAIIDAAREVEAWTGSPH